MKLATTSFGTALLCLGLAACSQAESRNATTAADNVVGILQCDDYLAKVNTCIHERVPADQRAALAAEAHRCSPRGRKRPQIPNIAPRCRRPAA